MTAFEQWADHFRENYRAFNPVEYDIAELAFKAALEHAVEIAEEADFGAQYVGKHSRRIRMEISK